MALTQGTPLTGNYDVLNITPPHILILTLTLMFNKCKQQLPVQSAFIYYIHIQARALDTEILMTPDTDDAHSKRARGIANVHTYARYYAAAESAYRILLRDGGAVGE